jgi:hypothetical protein
MSLRYFTHRVSYLLVTFIIRSDRFDVNSFTESDCHCCNIKQLNVDLRVQQVSNYQMMTLSSIVCRWLEFASLKFASRALEASS